MRRDSLAVSMRAEVPVAAALRGVGLRVARNAGCVARATNRSELAAESIREMEAGAKVGVRCWPRAPRVAKASRLRSNKWVRRGAER